MRYLALAPVLLFSLIHATPALAEPLKLTATQLQGLGIQTQLVPEGGQGVLKGLPARVEVPAGQMQVLAAPVDGTLQEVLVAPGMPVKKGQVVARLMSPQALELQRAYAEASARSSQARAALQRDEQLHKEGIIAAARLEATRAQAAEAGAQFEQSRQGLSLAGGNPGRMGPVLNLTASMEGLVLEQLAEVGQRIPAATPIVKVGRLKPLWLEIRVPQAVAAQVKVGDGVQIPARNIAGKLLAVGRAVDPASQNVTLRAQVDEGSEALSPGQMVEVEISVRGQTGQALPARAVARHGGALLAFVQSPGGNGQNAEKAGVEFQPRPVQVLSQVGDTLLVSGLKPGERVVVQGVSGLKAMLLNGAGGN